MPNFKKPCSRRLRWSAIATLAILGAMGLWFSTGARDSKPRFGRNSVLGESAKRSEASHYAGSQSCRECHEEEYKLWSNSHHGLAQRRPNPINDAAAFVPSRNILAGTHRVMVRKQGADYLAETVGLGKTQQVFTIAGVLGESPLRQFLVRFPERRLQALEAAYDPRSNDWFNVYGTEDRHPGEWGHWTGRGMNWNSMCAGCHDTRLEKNYDATSDSYNTTMAEESVGCESCHGPLQQHNEWQRQFGHSGRQDPTLHKLSHERTTDNCGFCHARRGQLTGDFKPGDDFLDDMRLEIVDGSETFYPDGQVREEAYEYAAFLGSRMHLRGVHCMDCHNPHSAKTILPGNWLCMRCHNGSYTNAPIIDPVQHSHHQVFGYNAKGVQTNFDLTAYRPSNIKETGGECVNCHMPQTAYMQRHWRHDHGFTTPDPWLTKQARVPNACNRCHRDRDADWALKWCDDWYGPKMERPSRDRALLIAAARTGDPAARPGLLTMLATNDSPYWRAVAGGLLGLWATDQEVLAKLRTALQDTNALVRIQCIRALESEAHESEVAGALKQCLNDPVRGVRVAAAWALRTTLDTSSKAGADLQQCLAFNVDQPAGQVQLAAFALAREDPASAVRHYETAIKWDPYSAAIRHDYAVVLAGLHRAEDALQQMLAACRIEPTNAEFQYSLALAWNEAGRTDNAIDCLQKTVKLAPGFATAWYNLGLALNAQGRSEEALDALVRAETINASDLRAPYARATILAKMGRLPEAKQAARRALEIDPASEAARLLLRNLEAPRGGAQ